MAGAVALAAGPVAVSKAGIADGSRIGATPEAGAAGALPGKAAGALPGMAAGGVPGVAWGAAPGAAPGAAGAAGMAGAVALAAGPVADSEAGIADGSRIGATPDAGAAGALPGMAAGALPGMAAGGVPGAAWGAAPGAAGAAGLAGAVALAAGPVADAALAAASPGAAAVAEALVAATPGQSGFAPQLGVQLTLFAREGVQFARLQLNPAELGPVWVQIQIEGQAAQVHLAAENAFTREQLGDALPALAGSLREAGLTLSGGGVFDQPRQREAFGNPDRGVGAAGARVGATPGAAEAHDAAPGALRLPRRRRGIVDLIA
jgi:flagellar hook-length control protein FliK